MEGAAAAEAPAADGESGNMNAAAGWSPAGGGACWGAAAAQAFMRKDTEEELREKWVAGRQDARAAFKKRHADSARQQRLRARGAGGGAKKGSRGGGE